MTDDITTALETLRGVCLDGASLTALGMVEAELTRLRDHATNEAVMAEHARAQTASLRAERDEWRTRAYATGEACARAEAERDEAVATLRDIGNDADAYHPLAVKARDALAHLSSKEKTP